MILIPVLQIQCSIPSVDNGYITASSGSEGTDMVLPVRSNITFHCYNGYRLVGSNQLQCIIIKGVVADWSGSIPTCQGL